MLKNSKTDFSQGDYPDRETTAVEFYSRGERLGSTVNTTRKSGRIAKEGAGGRGDWWVENY